ncbi:MAG: hypothetical protein M3313_03015 [Actinomycetota bacterium]|nr:hypothetical protein [Actinomycetota bacterium]
MTDAGLSGAATVLVLDMANVLGSVPDGWWRDRAGASERLMHGLGRLSGGTVTGPDGQLIRLTRIVAVLEGTANLAADPAAGQRDGRLEVARARGSGDDEISDLVAGLTAAGADVLVVTADRDLRARLPAAASTTGPGWLNKLLGRG